MSQPASSTFSQIKLRNPIMLALDVDDETQALKIAHEVGPALGAIKVGPRLIVRYGAQLIQKLAPLAPIFIDHKFFDIPSTMEGAIEAAFDAGATFATVHAAAGLEALTRLHALERKLNARRPFQILCVTILTSFDQASLPPLQRDFPIQRHIEELASLIKQSGLTGIVCSPHEIALVREKFAEAFVVTPGIRLAEKPSESPGSAVVTKAGSAVSVKAGFAVSVKAGSAVVEDDQKRIMTPKLAMSGGASALVIGRPILQAANRKSMIQDILKQIQN